MKKKRAIIKTITVKIAVSFFFAAIFIVIIYALCNSKLDYYAKIVNKMVVNNDIIKETKFNKESSRVIERPTYGTQYADLIFDDYAWSFPLFYGDNLSILKNGVGHYSGSYFPGENGSIIIAGHNYWYIFKNLELLNPGDKVTIEANYGTFYYEVTESKIVNMNDLSAFPIQHDEELLVMYTCWPTTGYVIGGYYERLVVYARKVGETYE